MEAAGAGVKSQAAGPCGRFLELRKGQERSLEMKVMMVVEGDCCGLKIDPEDDEGSALLAAFGITGTFYRRLGGTQVPLAL